MRGRCETDERRMKGEKKSKAMNEETELKRKRRKTVNTEIVMKKRLSCKRNRRRRR
jgi:hypothetical protein